MGRKNVSFCTPLRFFGIPVKFLFRMVGPWALEPQTSTVSIGASTNSSPVPSSPGRSTKCLGAKRSALARGNYTSVSDFNSQRYAAL